MVKLRNGAPVVSPIYAGPIETEQSAIGSPRLPEPGDLIMQPKVRLLEMAEELGLPLDGSETKSDVIQLIERQRRAQGS